MNGKYFEAGTTLYLYTIRTGVLKVHKATVFNDTGMYWRYPRVKFETKQGKGWCPKRNEVGVIQTGGPSLWLDKRNDDLAAKLFLDYENGKLAELEKQVDKKKALLKMLESVGMES